MKPIKAPQGPEPIEPARCKATVRRTGLPCKKYPVKGSTVCPSHGGNAPQVRRKARERLEQQEAARRVAEWGGRLDISAPEALMELVQTKAAEVAYWNDKVSELDPGERAGMLESKTEEGWTGESGSFDSTTKQASPHIALVMLHKAQDQLASYAAAAVRAGLDEALVKLHTLQGGLLLQALRAAVAEARASSDAEDDVVRLVLTRMGEGR